MPRTGRPKGDNSIVVEVKCRVTADTYQRLLNYCKINGVTKSEVIRNGLNIILDKK